MLYILAACTPVPGGWSSEPALQAEETSIPTGFDVTVSDAAGASAVALVGYDADGDAFDVDAVAQDDGTWLGQLRGLPAGTTWQVYATVTVAGTPTSTESIELVVPAAPSDLPAFDVDVAADDGALTLLTLPTSEYAAVVIVDRLGRYRWWVRSDEDTAPIIDAWPTHDGSAILWLEEGTTPTLHRTPIDGSDAVVLEIPEATHDLVELPDGDYGVLTRDTREVSGIDVDGDAISIVHADGSGTETLWSTWDDIVYAPGTGESVDGVVDWSHANSLRYDETTDQWLVSLRSLNTVVDVDGATGGVNWMVGDVQGAIPCPDGAMKGQHGATFVPGGFAVFNNRESPDTQVEDLWSEALFFKLDADARTVEPTWRYAGNHQYFSAVMGNVDLLPDDDRLIGWGVAGVVDEVTADSTLVWELSASLGFGFGNAHRLDTVDLVGG